ncbi:methyltransferase domain-containing protein [Peribacillus simplex]|uniref:class I SAM-dependent methyltransferase n=1 Tax=Peribacillus simplex TaxID=1478 RepID=UPI002989B4BE|nr:methyltransferase domain-containing protein [Peribacillus simplex]MBX9958385.1 methyltransferase domain-containing protein [Peribacillus simplex]
MDVNVNFGNVAKNYAQWRNDLPDELLESLKIRGINFSNVRVADLGSGTGVWSRALFNEGAKVVGVEPSEELIEEALNIDKRERMNIDYVNRYSENTTLESNNFDYVTVLRAWHWFDREATLKEVKRILRENGGTLLVMDSGFISKSKIIKDTLQIIKNHMPNGELKSAGSKAHSKQFINNFPIEWFQEWKENQFDLIDTYKFEYEVSFRNDEWCGRVGSLSWLSSFTENKRVEILEEIRTHLIKVFGDIDHKIQHGCYVAILKLL